MTYDICIIGGGASGMAAAICAGRLGAKTILLERMPRPGKKILATGNGRCNLSNTALSEAGQKRPASEFYRGCAPSFAEEIVSAFPLEKLTQFLYSVGIYTHTRGPYVYPRSDQAAFVRAALEWAMQETGCVRICADTAARGISVRETTEGLDHFKIDTENDIRFQARKVILATGGCAAPKQGSDGSGYALAEGLGHRIIPPLPALTALRCRETYLGELAGIRCQVAISLYQQKNLLAREEGELQMTRYGISGIPVFQLSRFASAALSQGNPVTAVIDFLPDIPRDRLLHLIKTAASEHPDYRMPMILGGLLPDKLAGSLCALADSASKKRPAHTWEDSRLERLTGLVKAHPLHVTASNGFAQAQVTCGGVDTGQVNPHTMESRLQKGLYLTGELLDVDGICGGFNLHFALASGCIAGQAAAKKE